MSTNQELRIEVQGLRSQIREKLLTAAEKSFDKLLPHFPKEPGEKLGAISAANIRWEMIQAGFTYEEVQAIFSKMNALTENKTPFPATVAEWTYFIEDKYLGYITPTTHRFTLGLLQRRYSRRLTGPLLNAHERTVVSIGKRIRAIHEKIPVAQVEQVMADIAASAGVQAEMVWRVATGGTRVTGAILGKMDHCIRQMESDLEDSGE